MPIVRESRLINKLQFAATYVHSILISKSGTADYFCIYDRDHQSVLLEIFLFHNTRELNYFRLDERSEDKCAAWLYSQESGFNHGHYYSCKDFRSDAEMPSKSLDLYCLWLNSIP